MYNASDATFGVNVQYSDPKGHITHIGLFRGD